MAENLDVFTNSILRYFAFNVEITKKLQLSWAQLHQRRSQKARPFVNIPKNVNDCETTQLFGA